MWSGNNAARSSTVAWRSVCAPSLYNTVNAVIVQESGVGDGHVAG